MGRVLLVGSVAGAAARDHCGLPAYMSYVGVSPVTVGLCVLKYLLFHVLVTWRKCSFAQGSLMMPFGNGGGDGRARKTFQPYRVCKEWGSSV